MNFDLTEEQHLIQQTAREFAETELTPVAGAVDRGEADDQFLENLSKLARLGFMGLNVNQRLGGAEAGVVAFSLVITELAKVCASTAVTVSVNNMVCELLQNLGTQSQKDTYIPKLTGGNSIAAGFALTEPGAGSDPTAMTTTAVKQQDGWLLNGSKVFITSGSIGDFFLVWAKTDPEAARGEGISLFLIDKDLDGLRISKNENKLGQKGSPTNELYFENCTLTRDALVGGEHEGYKAALQELAGGRIGIGSLALGLGLAAMDTAVGYSLERSQFGRRISSFQGIQWKIADMYTELEASRLLVLHAAFQKEKKRDYSKAAAMAKLHASEAANNACNEALQMLGGYGYTTHFPVERYLRDARVTTIYEGTSEIQRIIIAREILKEFS